MQDKKVIKFGNSSYVVTLPNEWVRENSISKNSTLYSKSNKFSIIYTTKKEIENRQGEIIVDNMPFKLVNKKLMSFYLNNYTFIKVIGKNVIEKLDEIKTLLSKLSSIDIVEIQREHILIRNFLNPTDLNLDSIIERTYKMELTLFDEIIENYKTTSQTFVNTLDTNVNKLSFLAIKCLNYNISTWNSLNYATNSINYWRIISAFENIGDVLKRIARYIIGPNPNIEMPELIIGLKQLKDYFLFSIKMLKKEGDFNEMLAHYLDKKQSLLREFEDLKRYSDNKNLNFLLILLQLFRDIIAHIEVIIISILDIECHENE